MDSSNIARVTSSPGNVNKMSQYLEEQTRRDESCENSAEEDDSDSGDSLFITQVPVPEAVRSRRRTPPAPLHGGTGDTLLSDAHGKSKSYKKKINRILPKHNFFPLDGGTLTETVVRPCQNMRLHTLAMGGFFQSVKQLWQNYQTEGVEPSLPTVDVDGESLSPISDGEGERNEEKDIKVVPRRWLAVPSTARKPSRPWYTPTTEDSQLKQQKKRTCRKATPSTSRRGRKIPTTATVLRDTLSLGTKCSDDKEPSCRAPTSDRNDLAGTERPRTKRCLATEMKKVANEKNERKCDLYSNSGAIVCEPSPDGYVETDGEASAAVAEPQADVFHTDEPSQTGQTECEPETPDLLQSDTNNDTEREKDEGDHEGVEEGEGQSPEEPEGKDAAMEIAEVTPSPLQPTDEPGLNENGDGDEPRQEKGDGFNSEQEKKRERKALEAGDARQEVDGVGETDVRVEEEPALLGNGDPEDNDGGDVEQLKSSPRVELPNDDVKIRKKRTKRKKETDVTSDQTSAEQLEDERESLGTTEASQETLESSFVKRKKKKKRRTASNDDAQVGEGDCQDVSFSNDATTLEEGTGLLVKKKKKRISDRADMEDIAVTPEDDVNSVNTQTTTDGPGEQDAEVVTTKKKKKKKKKRISDREDIAVTPEDDVNSVNTQTTIDGPGEQDAEVATKKKKKKKKSREISSMEISSDTVAQSDDSVSVQKEEKKRTSSFLVADAEGKAAQTHEGKHPPSQSAAPVEFESAEIARGHLEESNGEVRKKKRKRKMSDAPESADKDHNPEFEEPNEMSEMTAAETGLKKNEERKRTESQSLNDMERWQSPVQTDEVAVLKKNKKKKKKETPPASSEETEKMKATAESSFSPRLSKAPLAQLEMSSSHSNKKNKLAKTKRNLYSKSFGVLMEFDQQRDSH